MNRNAMDIMYMDTYWFFVPNRLVCDNWKEFDDDKRDVKESDVE